MPDNLLPFDGGKVSPPSTDFIVDGTQTLTATFRRLAIRRTSQGFEVVHRFAGEWVGLSYPACVRSHLEAARADLILHVEKDADKKRDWVPV